jgi:hypothetical protein
VVTVIQSLVRPDIVSAVERPWWAPIGIDINSPSPARIYDYYLDGIHNFPVDRSVADQVLRTAPELPRIMRANRAFLARAVRFLVDSGVRQFLDLGSGIPTADNVHQIAHRVAPDTRVAYVDTDQVAVAHSRAILEGKPNLTVVQEDLRNVAGVLRAPEVSTLIDFSQPVAVLMVGVLHFVADSDDVDSILAGYRHAVAEGSYLVLSHAPAHEDDAPEGAEEAHATYSSRVTEFTPRTRAAVAAMFTDLELVDPGIVPVEQWRPDGNDTSGGMGGWVGVARKPTR